jgi:hypothetical protein
MGLSLGMKIDPQGRLIAPVGAPGPSEALPEYEGETVQEEPLADNVREEQLAE